MSLTDLISNLPEGTPVSIKVALFIVFVLAILAAFLLKNMSVLSTIWPSRKRYNELVEGGGSENQTEDEKRFYRNFVEYQKFKSITGIQAWGKKRELLMKLFNDERCHYSPSMFRQISGHLEVDREELVFVRDPFAKSLSLLIKLFLFLLTLQTFLTFFYFALSSDRTFLEIFGVIFLVLIWVVMMFLFIGLAHSYGWALRLAKRVKMKQRELPWKWLEKLGF